MIDRASATARLGATHTVPARGDRPLSPLTTAGRMSATVNMRVLSLLTQPAGAVFGIPGFAEDLYVGSLATDGWSRIVNHDSNPATREPRWRPRRSAIVEAVTTVACTYLLRDF